MKSEFTLSVDRSLRYYLREAQSDTVHLVYLLHGYGQLAFYFLKKVEQLLPGNVVFVAPEGMHRFYLNGTAGRVGASWMTKEMRETDISENTKALDALHHHLQEQFSVSKVSVIGFSQGGATAARWVVNGNVKADLFVSWASVFPPDISFPDKWNSAKKNVFAVGDTDEFFDAKALEAATESYLTMGFDIVHFNGGHDLHPEILEKILRL